MPDSRRYRQPALAPSTASDGRLPVVVVSGPVGAGKGGVAAALAEFRPCVAVLRYSLAERREGVLLREERDPSGRTRTTRLPLTGGCVCCTLRLDAVVTVIDARRLVGDLSSDEDLGDRGLAGAVHDDRSVAEVLVDQLECADVIVLLRTACTGSRGSARVEALLDRLAPAAARVRDGLGTLAAAVSLGAGAFTDVGMPARAGWARQLAGHPLPTGEDAGVRTVTFRSRRPFAPARLYAALSRPFDGLIRSRGACWIATQPDVLVEWDQAGAVTRVGPGGRWLASGPAGGADAVRHDGVHRWLAAEWDPYYGDRRTELVLTGLNLDADALVARLQACLLTDAELALGEDGWRGLADPFA